MRGWLLLLLLLLRGLWRRCRLLGCVRGWLGGGVFARGCRGLGRRGLMVALLGSLVEPGWSRWSSLSLGEGWMNWT